MIVGSKEIVQPVLFGNRDGSRLLSSYQIAGLDRLTFVLDVLPAVHQLTKDLCDGK